MKMEARYATRKQQLLAECQVDPEIFDQVLPRLTTFMAPFVETFCRPELDQHAHTYMCGLLSDVDRKNIESIAYRFGEDVSEVLVCYSLGVYETQSNPQAIRVIE